MKLNSIPTYMYLNFALVFSQHFILAAIVGIEEYGIYFGIYAFFGVIEAAYTSRNGDFQLKNIRLKNFEIAEKARDTEITLSAALFVVLAVVVQFWDLEHKQTLLILLASIPVQSTYAHHKSKLYAKDEMLLLSRIELLIISVQIIAMLIGGFIAGSEGMAFGYLVTCIFKIYIVSRYGNKIQPSRGWRFSSTFQTDIGYLQAIEGFFYKHDSKY